MASERLASQNGAPVLSGGSDERRRVKKKDSGMQTTNLSSHVNIRNGNFNHRQFEDFIEQSVLSNQEKNVSKFSARDLDNWRRNIMTDSMYHLVPQSKKSRDCHRRNIS